MFPISLWVCRFSQEYEFYYLQSRYYNPKTGRFLNADAFASTGQGLLGNNMFAYCGNNPAIFEDPTGMRLMLRDPDPGKQRVGFTASYGAGFSAGIGSLSMTVQVSVVTDSSGKSELQIAYSAPNILSTDLPSVDDMMDIAKEFDIKLSASVNMAFTNAPSVTDLHGPTYSVGVSGPGVAIDYNAIPNGDNPKHAYSGVTFSAGAMSPGVNVSMTDTFIAKPINFNVFEFSKRVYNAMWGIY